MQIKKKSYYCARSTIIKSLQTRSMNAISTLLFLTINMGVFTVDSVTVDALRCGNCMQSVTLFYSKDNCLKKATFHSCETFNAGDTIIIFNQQIIIKKYSE